MELNESFGKNIKSHIDEVYLDNSATTRVSKRSCEKAVEMMINNYYNPSSLYEKGLFAEKELIRARETVANSINADAKEVFFTSGGTEANNLAVFGACNAKKRLGNKIITTKVEHSCVLHAFQHLEENGFSVEYLPVDKHGVVSTEVLENAIDENTILVSMMLVNNETGTIQSVEHIKKTVVRKKSPALIHCDAVQAFGKTEVNVGKLGVDLLAVSGHKVHAPKGVGALYLRKGIRISPMLYGGGQEQNIRPGTEAMPAICAFAAAVEEFDISASNAHYKELWSYCAKELMNLGGIVINSNDDCLKSVINFSVPGIRSEIMLHHLASMGICISSGSACSKGSPSHVLTAMGLDRKIADSALRASFSKYTNKKEIDSLIQGLKNGMERLIRK